MWDDDDEGAVGRSKGRKAECWTVGSTFRVRDESLAADYSETGTKSDSDGSKRLVGPVREAEADPGFGQREEENEDNQIVAEPRVERDNHFVSGAAEAISITSIYIWR